MNLSTKSVANVHLLFGQLLTNVTMHLLGREIEEDVLRPKVVQIVKGLVVFGD